MDPDEYAWAISRVVETGSITGIDFSNFYERTGIMLAFGAVSTVVMGVEQPAGMGIYAVLPGFLVPLAVGVSASRLWPRNPYAITYATAITAVASTTLKFTFWPIAQTLAAAFWTVFFLSFIHLIQTHDRRQYSILFIISIPLVFVHKLSPLYLVVVFAACTFAFAYRFARCNADSGLLKLTANSTLLFTLAAYIQWTHSEYFSGVVHHARAVFDRESAPVETISITHATPALDGTVYLLYRRAHALVLASLAVASVFVLWRRDRRVEVRAAVTTIVASMAFIGFAVIAPGLSVERLILFGEPLLALGAAIGLGMIATSRTVPHGEVVASILLIAVLAAQAFAAPAVPDATHQPRYYLEESEVESKEFANEFGPRTVYTDQYFAQERVDWSGDHDTTFEAIDSEYLVGTVDAEYVIYRDITIWYTPHLLPEVPASMWKLTWDPRDDLDSDCHQVFDSRNTAHYAC